MLELARSGADIAGIVTFHGGLDTPTRDAKNIKCKVLICHGADDPYVPATDVAALQDELRSGGGGLADDLLQRRGAQFHAARFGQ